MIQFLLFYKNSHTKCTVDLCPCYYRQPPKLREGNVLTSCVLVCLQGWSHVVITQNALDLTVHQPPPPTRHRASLGRKLHSPLVTSGGHHWRPVQLDHFRTLPKPVLTSGGYGSMYGLHKQVVRILLESVITGRNEVVAKVIFLHLFVILFTGGCLPRVDVCSWWGVCSGGMSARRGVSAPRGCTPGGSAPRGVCSPGPPIFFF